MACANNCLMYPVSICRALFISQPKAAAVAMKAFSKLVLWLHSLYRSPVSNMWLSVSEAGWNNSPRRNFISLSSSKLSRKLLHLLMADNVVLTFAPYAYCSDWYFSIITLRVFLSIFIMSSMVRFVPWRNL